MTQEQLLALLDRDRFERWLAAKDDAEQVGMSQAPTCCPLATYIKEEGGVLIAAVGAMVRAYPPASDPVCVGKPDWAVAFILALDKQFSPPQPVTAAQATKVLVTLP